MFRESVLLSSLFALLLSTNVTASSNGIDVSANGLVANYYPSTSENRKIPVLVLGGSEGGKPQKLATPIVKAGFPVLSLAYFKERGLPDELESIPLEYVNSAIEWLLKQEDVNTQQLTVVGWSKGAELALLMATRDERIKRVVAIAPSSAVWAGILKDWTKTPGSSWTENGKPLVHIPFKPSGPVNGLVDLYTQSLENRVDNGLADIPVKQIRADVFLLTGADDEIWPSPQMATSICEGMGTSAKNSCQHFNYDNMDHLLNYRFLEPTDPMHSRFINLITTTPGLKDSSR